MESGFLNLSKNEFLAKSAGEGVFIGVILLRSVGEFPSRPGDGFVEVIDFSVFTSIKLDLFRI